MDLTKISAVPVLVEVKLDDMEVMKEYGEALTFWTHDRQPIDIYLNLGNSMGVNQSKSVEILKTLVLDKDGNPVMSDGKILPAKIMVKAMTAVMNLLGK